METLVMLFVKVVTPPVTSRSMHCLAPDQPQNKALIRQYERRGGVNTTTESRHHRETPSKILEWESLAVNWNSYIK